MPRSQPVGALAASGSSPARLHDLGRRDPRRHHGLDTGLARDADGEPRDVLLEQVARPHEAVVEEGSDLGGKQRRPLVESPVAKRSA
jgi:hypothetical protein